MHTMQTITRTLESTLASIDDGEGAVVEFARRAGFGDAEVERLGLAVHEIIGNAVLHGNRCDPEKNIFVACAKTSERLVIAISDQGEGFAPDRVPDPASPGALLRPSGRGLYLARALTDECHIRTTKYGTTVVLVKYVNKNGRCS